MNGMGHDSESTRRTLFMALARKYVWWKQPDEAMKNQRRVIAQVMNIGDFDDVRAALSAFGQEPFEDALAHAEAGWFSPKSWAYWHYRFRSVAPGHEVPPMPVRVVSA